MHAVHVLSETEMMKRLGRFYQQSLRLLASRHWEHILRYILTWMTYVINPLLWITYGLCAALIPFGGLPEPYGFSIVGIGVLALILFAMLIFSQIRKVFISREEILSNKEREQLLSNKNDANETGNASKPFFKCSKLNIFDTVVLVIMIMIFIGSLFMCIYPYVAKNLDPYTHDGLMIAGFILLPLSGFTIISWIMSYVRLFLLRNVRV